MTENNQIAAEGDNITLYRKNTVQNHTYVKGLSLVAINRYENVLTLDTGETVRIRNVHGVFEHIPSKMETAVSTFLFEGDENESRIVVGDFNNPVSKLPGTEPELVTTSVAPGKFTTNDPIQHGHAIDTAYFRNTVTNTLHQAITTQYNPVTGLPFTKNELRQLPKNIPAQQKVLFERFRPATRIDNIYRATPFDDITDSHITPGQISALDQEFNDRFNSGLHVRYATDLLNRPGLSAFGPHVNTIESLRALFPEFQYAFHGDIIDPNDNKIGLISAPQCDSLKFIKAINAINLIQPLLDLQKKSPDQFNLAVKLLQRIVRDDSITFNQSTELFKSLNNLKKIHVITQLPAIEKEFSHVNGLYKELLDKIDTTINTDKISYYQSAKLLEAARLMMLMKMIPESQSELKDKLSIMTKTVFTDDAISPKQASKIFKHFEEPLAAIVWKRAPDMDLIIKSKKELNQTVHHTPMMDRGTKIAIGAAIGAVAAYSIFAVIATVLTLGTGLIPLTGLATVIGLSIFGAETVAAGAMVGGQVANKAAKTNPALSREYKNSFNEAAKATFTTLFKPPKQKIAKAQPFDSHNYWDSKLGNHK